MPTSSPAAGELSAGPDGPSLYPGPLCGGESGSTGRVAGTDMARAWMPELRQRRSGYPRSISLLRAFSNCCCVALPPAAQWATFLWPHRERWLARRRRSKALASIALIEVREALDPSLRWDLGSRGIPAARPTPYRYRASIKSNSLTSFREVSSEIRKCRARLKISVRSASNAARRNAFSA